MKKFIIFALAIGALFGATDVFAQATPAFLDGAITKGNALVDLLAGPVAKVLCTLVIVGVAIGWYFERMEKKTAIKIAVATVIITQAYAVVDWLFS